MKFLKLFAFVFLFVVSFFIFNSNTTIASEGYCRSDSWVYGTSGIENDPCQTRPEFSSDPDVLGCEQEPYYHLSKITTCIWDTGTPPNPLPPTADITASPSQISSGDISTLEWDSLNATTCTINGNTTGSLIGSSTVSPTTTTTYTLSCTGPGGTATDSTTVTVTPTPLVVTFKKDPNNIKNLIDKANPNAIGRVYFEITLTGLTETGKNCEYYENGAPIVPQKKWETDVVNEKFSRDNIQANNLSSMILCHNSDGGTIYSAHLGTSTQSATVGGATTCNIGFNKDTCELGINWTTVNPYNGNASFPASVTNLTVDSGFTAIDSGNIGSGVTRLSGICNAALFPIQISIGITDLLCNSTKYIVPSKARYNNIWTIANCPVFRAALQMPLSIAEEKATGFWL